jgi:hypothetical protein
MNMVCPMANPAPDVFRVPRDLDNSKGAQQSHKPRNTQEYAERKNRKTLQKLDH